MKNKYFKKITIVSICGILIVGVIIFFYREKVFRDERFMYEERLAEVNHLLVQAEEAKKAMPQEIAKEAEARKMAEEIAKEAEAEEIAKEAEAEEIAEEAKIEVEDSDEITRGDVTRDAVDSGETVQDEMSESGDSHSAWVAENRQMKVGAIPVRYYIEQTQIALEDTDENVGTVLYFENPVFLVEDSCDGWSWVDNPSPETVIINELLDKKKMSLLTGIK